MVVRISPLSTLGGLFLSLKTDLEAEVQAIFRNPWTKRNGNVVPDDTSIKLGNDAVELEATVLYADMTESTKLVDKKKGEFAAEVYKSFLHTAAKIIKDLNGTITAYDGDRIMAVYIGDLKNTSAVKSALRLHYAQREIIQPALKAVYKEEEYAVRHTTGIDTSKLLVAKTGVRGSNDLVWVGRAANWAAKLCSLSSDYPTRITKAVYDKMTNDAKFAGDGRNMWEERSWTAMNNTTIYRSNFWWAFS